MKRKSKITNPHDRFFRSAMKQKQVAKEFFLAHLPSDVSRALDLDSLVQLNTSFIEEDLKEQISDLLFECTIGRSPKPTKAYIYLLVEHQSTPQRLLPFRIFKYLWGAMDSHLKQHKTDRLPVIFPLVFYNGRISPYPFSMNLLDLFDDPLKVMPKVLHQPIPLVDVHKLTEAEIEQFPWLSPATKVMQHIRDEDILPILESTLQQLALLLNQSDDYDYLISIINYAIQAGNVIDVTEFEKIIPELPEPARGRVMTIAEKLMHKGHEKGVEQGIEQGIQKVAISMLKMGSDVKFVSKATQLSIEQVKQIQQTLEIK